MNKNYTGQGDRELVELSWGIKPVCVGRSIWFGVSGGRQEESSRRMGRGQNLRSLECHHGEF